MKNITAAAINYDELLQYFVSTDQLRPHFISPNTQEGYVYATDCHHIMRVSAKLVAGEYPNLHKHRFADIWPDPHRLLDTPVPYAAQSIQDAILKIPKIMVEEKEECEKCDGEGVIYCTHCGHSNDCNECDGHGCIPTGRKKEMLDPEYSIRFGGATIVHPRFLHNLLRCAEATGQPVYRISVCDTKMILFQTGEIQVGIMPIMGDKRSKKAIDVSPAATQSATQ